MSEDYQDVYVHAATVASLLPYLRVDVPFVWIIGHMPNTAIEWWQTDIPLNTNGSRLEADVRLLSYDLQVPTAKFLENAAAFEKCGLTLVQSYRRMPGTLQLHRLSDEAAPTVLKRNGAFLYIELPHPAETARVRCFELGYLSKFTAA